MTALNDPGQPEDHDEDMFDNPPLPHPENGQDQSDDDWGDSDDDEEDRGGVDGYQLLPQELPSQQQTQEEPGTVEQVDDCLSDGDDDVTPPNVASLNPNATSFEEEARLKWVAEEGRERVEVFASTSTREIDLNVDKLSAIQTAMAKISLPPTSIPAWAGKLSDEDWNKLIHDKFGAQHKTENSAPQQNTDPSSSSSSND